MPIIENIGEGEADSLEVTAIMCWPKDLQARIDYVACVTADRLLRAGGGENVACPKGLLNAVLEARSRSSLTRDIGEATKRGSTAGYIFAFMHLMDMRRDELPPRGAVGASISKAKHIAARWLNDKREWGDGSPVSASDRTIENSWREYRSVAHLWAAFELSKAVKLAPDRQILSADYISTFLRAASRMQQFGLSHRLDNRADSRAGRRTATTLLIQESAWLIDAERYPASLDVSGRTMDWPKYLKDYMAGD